MTLPDSPRSLDMVPYDYFAPWVAVTLLLEDGSEFPLWQGTGFIEDGSADKVKFTGTNLAVLQEVLIEWQGMAYNMTINLSPNYDDAIKIVDSYLIQIGKTLVTTKIGFLTSGQGPIEQVFNGVVNSVDFSVGTETSLVLHTNPPRISAAKSQESDKNNKAEPWNNKSALDIIKELWESQNQLGLSYKVEILAEDGDAAIQFLKEKRDSFSRGGQTDLAVIQKLADMNFCTALADGVTLKIDSKKRVIGTVPPVAAFHLFSGSTLGGNTAAYPITSVSLKTSDMFARTLQGRLRVGFDEKTGEAVKKTLGTAEADETGADVGAQTLPKSAKKPGGGPSPDASVVPAGGAGTTLVQDPKDKQEGRSALAQTVKEWAKQGIQLEIETLLIPHLLPHANVDVTGLGGRVDGRYWIEKLFMQIGPDGGLTRFECVQVGLSEGPDQAEPLTGQPNKAPEAEVTGGATTEASAIPEDGQ